MQSTTITSRKGAPTYNRFVGSNNPSSDTTRGRAVTISISSTAKPKEPRRNQTKAKDDSAVRSVTSPQNVSDVEKKSTPIMSPEPSATSDGAPIKSSPPDNDAPPQDEIDIGTRKTGQPVTNKQSSTDKKSLPSTKPSNEKAEFQGFKLRKTGLSVHDKGRSNRSKVSQLFHTH